MKVGALVGGIIILIIGVIGYTSTSTTVSERQTTIGEVERFFSEESQTTYQSYQYAQLGSAVLAVIGIGVLVYGAGAKSEKKKESIFYCKYCKYPAQSYNEYQNHLQHCSKKPKEESSQLDDLKNLGILKERLAKGEITKEEYDSLKKEFER